MFFLFSLLWTSGCSECDIADSSELVSSTDNDRVTTDNDRRADLDSEIGDSENKVDFSENSDDSTDADMDTNADDSGNPDNDSASDENEEDDQAQDGDTAAVYDDLDGDISSEGDEDFSSEVDSGPDIDYTCSALSIDDVFIKASYKVNQQDEVVAFIQGDNIDNILFYELAAGPSQNLTVSVDDTVAGQYKVSFIPVTIGTTIYKLEVNNRCGNSISEEMFLTVE